MTDKIVTLENIDAVHQLAINFKCITPAITSLRDKFALEPTKENAVRFTREVMNEFKKTEIAKDEFYALIIAKYDEKFEAMYGDIK